ncbi:recombinase family protein [Corynebacterium flavescens]|uniref:recombinase family protein n=1 Tax=Corynebacterium flavescens TaxID=28028 RepID=UPI003FD0275D
MSRSPSSSLVCRLTRQTPRRLCARYKCLFLRLLGLSRLQSIFLWDRLARSLRDLHTLVDELTASGVRVQFLQEGQTYSDDPSPSSRLLLSMLGAVAEFERSIIRERQADGIARAKARGVYKGRAPVPDEKIEQARELIAQGIPKARVARNLGISRSSLYKYLSENHPTHQ